MTQPDNTPKEKGRPDWERIEALYRVGVLSLREIGKQSGISEGAIRKKAKVNGWMRDLTHKVAAQVRNTLVRNELRASTLGSSTRLRTEREVVSEAAATVVEVVRDHRQDIRHSRSIFAALSQQLLDVVGDRDALVATIEDETKDDKSTERYTRLMRAVALPGHIVAVKDLALAQRTLIGLERQAFGLADVEDPTPVDDGKAGQVTPSDEALAKLGDLLTSAAAAA